jgi:hypothetical protein
VPAQIFTVRVYLTRVPVPYEGQFSQVYFDGVSSTQHPRAVWTGCVFEAWYSASYTENVGCTIGIPPAATPVIHLGLVSTFEFRCDGNGRVSLGYGLGETSIIDEDFREHRGVGEDRLEIDCGVAPPTPTRTPFLCHPYGDVNDNGSIDAVDAALILQFQAGLIGDLPNIVGADVNIDGIVNAVDAAIILQAEGGLLSYCYFGCCP